MIGVIADDVTGGTDVAVAFRRQGLSTLLLFGLPGTEQEAGEHDVVVIALKTRTISADEAVGLSLQAATWLDQQGATQLYFKYCSTFDSNASGNIGPVLDALADFQGSELTVVVPASPEHARTQYMGHLFVGSQLLADSPMRYHPLTPMKDSRVERLLGAQTGRRTGLIERSTLQGGPVALAGELQKMRERAVRYVVIDAISEADLKVIAEACIGHPLLSGAAGLAGAVAAAMRRRGTMDTVEHDPVGAVPAAVLAGSCSARTRQQVACMRSAAPAHFVDVSSSQDPQELATRALYWFDELEPRSTPLFFSTVEPDVLEQIQREFGTERTAAVLEEATGLIAQGLYERGIRRLVTAGGETSGAVVAALELKGGSIGAEVAPGVPWIYSDKGDGLAIMLKSGNFGDPDLLLRSVGLELAQRQQVP